MLDGCSSGESILNIFCLANLPVISKFDADIEKHIIPTTYLLPLLTRMRSASSGNSSEYFRIAEVSPLESFFLTLWNSKGPL